MSKTEAAEGRLARKRRNTRAILLKSAFDVMTEVGVNAATIKDITDRADIGFGTFYNYFQTKDEIAGQVLDCIIEDVGRRNFLATRTLHEQDPGLVMPVSVRLTMREAMRNPMWQWWARRPDLLVDRMHDGFKPFAVRDMRTSIETGVFRLDECEIDSAWAMINWLIVGGIYDVIVGPRPPESEMFVAASVMRMMGVSFERSIQISGGPLPPYPPPAIDWHYKRPEPQSRRKSP